MTDLISNITPVQYSVTLFVLIIIGILYRYYTIRHYIFWGKKKKDLYKWVDTLEGIEKLKQKRQDELCDQKKIKRTERVRMSKKRAREFWMMGKSPLEAINQWEQDSKRLMKKRDKALRKKKKKN